jgi:hypothetical protein
VGREKEQNHQRLTSFCGMPRRAINAQSSQ